MKSVNTLKTTVKGLAGTCIKKYYHRSPKRREIKAVANIINTDLANILDVKEVILISICSYKKKL